MVRAEQKEYFLEFIAIQLCRRPENLKKLGIDFVVDQFINIMKEWLPENFFKRNNKFRRF